MDTAAKRYSAIAPLLPWRGPPLPDGDIDQGDRQHVALCYSGILAEEPAEDETVVSGSITFSPKTRSSSFSLSSRRTTITGE